MRSSSCSRHMTCKNEVRRVTIDPSLLADDKDMLEDLKHLLKLSRFG